MKELIILDTMKKL